MQREFPQRRANTPEIPTNHPATFCTLEMNGTQKPRNPYLRDYWRSRTHCRQNSLKRTEIIIGAMTMVTVTPLAMSKDVMDIISSKGTRITIITNNHIILIIPLVVRPSVFLILIKWISIHGSSIGLRMNVAVGIVELVIINNLFSTSKNPPPPNLKPKPPSRRPTRSSKPEQIVASPLF